MKKVIKRILNLICKVLFFIGVGNFLHRMNQDKITIISMHGVMREHSKVLWHPLREQLDPKSLDVTIATLSKYYTFISLEQAHSILSGLNKPVKNALVITMDDGYWNNLEYAGPIFNKYNIIPTIFVATNNIEQCSPFWFDRLDYALQQIEGTEYKIKLLGNDFSFNLRSHKDLKNSYATFRSIIKSSFIKDEDMRDLLDKLSSELENKSGKSLKNIISKDDWTRIASWEELRKVSHSGMFNVGSHTVDHIRIALVDDGVMAFQLQSSKDKIEKEIGGKCNYFCYPNGSYNEKSTEKVKETGYFLAVTTENGLNSIGCDLMTLKRFNIPSKKTKNGILYGLSSFKV